MALATVRDFDAMVTGFLPSFWVFRRVPFGRVGRNGQVLTEFLTEFFFRFGCCIPRRRARTCPSTCSWFFFNVKSPKMRPKKATPRGLGFVAPKRNRPPSFFCFVLCFSSFFFGFFFRFHPQMIWSSVSFRSQSVQTRQEEGGCVVLSPRIRENSDAKLLCCCAYRMLASLSFLAHFTPPVHCRWPDSVGNSVKLGNPRWNRIEQEKEGYFINS